MNGLYPVQVLNRVQILTSCPHFHTHFRIMTVGVYILLPCMLVSWALADLMFQFSSTIVIAALFLVTTPVQVITLHTLIPIATYFTQTTLYILTYVRMYVAGCTHTHQHISYVHTLVSGHTHTHVHMRTCMYV